MPSSRSIRCILVLTCAAVCVVVGGHRAPVRAAEPAPESAFAIIAMASTPAPAGNAAGVPARAKYLVLDSRIIDRTDNAKLTVGTVEKHPRNPLFGEDKPWEQRFDNMYANVLFDEADGLYKLWYNPFIYDTSSKGVTLEQRHKTRYSPRRREDGICCAISRDGLKWVKPKLGLIEYEGNKANNLVLRGSHGAGVFKDTHDPDPMRRYKMFHARDVLRFSPDGLRWSNPAPCEGIDSNGDSHNHMLWAPDLERYVAFVRLRGGSNRRSGQRVVGRSESADLKSWTRAVEVLRIDADGQEAYSMPVFRYADIYLGLVAVFRTRPVDRVHTELAWSPDTVKWHRIDPGTPLIGNAPNEGDYDWGCVYAADDPVVLDDEIRIYYLGSNGKHTSWRDGFFCLATLRPDGFAGYEPIDAAKPATVVTRPVVCSGKTLRITADARGGSVRVTVLDADGKTVTAGRPIIDDVTGAPVTLRGGADLSKLHGSRVRLKFELTKAKLYAFALTQ